MSTAWRLALAGAVGLAFTTAHAEPRPTEGGIWSFSPGDVVESWEEPTGMVRVHYSVAGPHATLLADDDGDEVPDFAQLVARTTAAALSLYVDELGLRPPVAEAEVGRELGGSGALDVYLVDFGGAADGRFGIDACERSPWRCAGFLVIENDFAGYGYGSLDEAVDVVASHEGFHAVQAAYGALPVWMSEGTAVWAERQHAAEWPDFLHWCDAYLADPGRPLDQPPLGPVPGFAYGTALWWDFLSTRHDAAIVGEILAGMETADGEEADGMTAVVAALDGRGDALDDAFGAFARYDLAVGHRAGGAPTHEYAAQLEAIVADEEGEALDVDARVYPVSTQYWRIDHPGGPLWLGTDAALPGVVASLHAVADGEADGVVGDALSIVKIEAAGAMALADGVELAAGGYWLVIARPVLADGSARARVCVGGAEHAEGCVPDESTGGSSDDGSSGGEDESTGGSASTGAGEGTGGVDEGSSDDDGAPAAGGGEGCGCRSGGGGGALALLVPAMLLRRRRRPARWS